MVRTQIYLTEHQRKELAAIAKAIGKKQSEIIRELLQFLLKLMKSTFQSRAETRVARMHPYLILKKTTSYPSPCLCP